MASLRPAPGNPGQPGRLVPEHQVGQQRSYPEYRVVLAYLGPGVLSFGEWALDTCVKEVFQIEFWQTFVKGDALECFCPACEDGYLDVMEIPDPSSDRERNAIAIFRDLPSGEELLWRCGAYC